jgi:hypothetical protein
MLNARQNRRGLNLFGCGTTRAQRDGLGDSCDSHLGGSCATGAADCTPPSPLLPLTIRWDLIQDDAAIPHRQRRDGLADARSPSGNGNAESTKLELVLYVSAESPASVRAQRTMEQVLRSFSTDEVVYRVCDLSHEPHAGAADRVVFTPTLVRRSPGPRAWVLGNLENASIVTELLMAAGVTRRD